MDLDFYALQRGEELPPLGVAVSAVDVGAYLEATGESPEAWSEFVPPLQIGAYALAALMQVLPLPDGALHTGQEFEFLRPVVPGEELATTVRVAQRAERGGALFLAFDFDLSDGEGPALRGRSTVVAPLREGAAAL